MEGVDDFTSDDGRRFVRLIDELVVQLQEKEIDVLSMGTSEISRYAKQVAREIETQAGKERESGLCGSKKDLTVMHVQPYIKEIVEALSRDSQMQVSDIPLRQVRPRSNTDMVGRELVQGDDVFLTQQDPPQLG